MMMPFLAQAAPAVAEAAGKDNTGKYLVETVGGELLGVAPHWSFGGLFTVHLPSWMPVHALMMLLVAVALLVLFLVVYRHQAKVPTGWTNLLEVFVKFVRDEICVPNLGEHLGHKLTPLFCTFFFFVLGMNLMGLVPLFAPPTGNIAVTGALAVITFVFMVGGALLLNGPVGFMKAFVPSGVPLVVLVMMVPIEVVSLFFKVFALMIRLFANMVAGHLAILTILGMIVLFSPLLALLAVPLAVGIDLLEVLVVFLQAYIFTMLSAMFMGQLYHPEH